MAEEKPYLPSMPSLTSGVAPVNDSVGKEFRALSSNIGDVRQQLGQTAAARNNVLLGPLGAQAPYIGHAIGRLLHQNQVATAATQKMMGDLAIAQKKYEVQRQLSDAADTVKQNFGNDPTKAGPAFDEYAKGVAKAAANDMLTDPQFKKNPQFAFKLREELYNVQNSENDKIANWSLTTQVSNSTKITKNALSAERDGIAQADGTLQAKLQAFQDSKARVKTLVDNQSHFLGQATAEAMVNEHTLKAGVAFFQNAMASVPDNPAQPEQAVMYTRALSRMLDTNEAAGIPLGAHDKLQLQTMLNTITHQNSRDLIDSMTATDLQNEVKVSGYKNHIDSDPANRVVQLQAIQFADQGTHALELQLQQVAKNPLLNDQEKNAKTGSLRTQINGLHSLADGARANIRQTQSDQRREENDHLTGLRAEAKQLKDDAKEAKADTHEAHSNASLEAQSQAFDMRAEMKTLVQNPDKNNDTIVQRGTEMTKQVLQWRDQRLLTPSQANADAEYYSNAVLHAQTMKRKAPNVFGGITFPQWGNNPVKKQSFDKTMNDREKAAKALYGIGKGLQNTNDQHQLNQVAGLTTPDQQAVFAKASAAVRTKAQAEGANDWQVNQKLEALRQRVLTTMPAKAAPAAKKSKDGLVPPPPPDTPTIPVGGKMTRSQLKAMGIEVTD